MTKRGPGVHPALFETGEGDKLLPFRNGFLHVSLKK